MELSLFAYYGIFRASGSIKDDDGFELDRENLNTDFASYESQVVRLADDIAWTNHDLTEDGKLGIREPLDLLKIYEKNNRNRLSVHPEDLKVFIGKAPGERYGIFVTDVINNNQGKLIPGGFVKIAENIEGYTITLSEQMDKYLNEMNNMVVSLIHKESQVKRIAKKSQKKIFEICDFLYKENNIEKFIHPDVFFGEELSDMLKLKKLRVIIDAVSIISDSQATKFYEIHLDTDMEDENALDPLDWPLS